MSNHITDYTYVSKGTRLLLDDLSGYALCRIGNGALPFSDAYWPGVGTLVERDATTHLSCTQVTASTHLSTTSTIIMRHRCCQV